MQIKFEDIRYDNDYIYALGTNLFTGVKRHIKISRVNDDDFYCEGGYETVFFRGAVELLCILRDKGKLPSKKSFMWE